MLQTGEQVQNFRVVRSIGSGGMSEVYLVRDNLDRQFAMKVLSANLTRDPTFKERFRHEAKIMATLNHPSIVKLHSYIEPDDKFCLVMEYVEGGSLKDLIRRTGPIPEERALKIFRQIAEALAYAHGKGVIHRDIKPSNILIGEDDSVKVMDFGIARMTESPGLTRTGTQMGTLVYMSPEQIRDSKHVDCKSDVYSLGVTLYEMLTGKAPYDEATDSDYDIRVSIVNKALPDPRQVYPHISGRAVSLITEMTRKESGVRPDIAGSLSLLEEKRDEMASAPPSREKKEPPRHQPVPAAPENPEPAVKPHRRRYSRVIAVVLLVLIAAGIVWLIDSSKKGPAEVEPAVDVSELDDLVLVEGGTFQMGSDSGDEDEKPVHAVTLSSFYMGKYEVTQAQWQAVMGSNPSNFKGDNLPVEQVSWYDAVEFCNKLSLKEGLTPCYSGSGTSITCDFTANGYRLPTEAEWEYAARGGNSSRNFTYSGSNDLGAVGWFADNAGSHTHPAGQKLSNELGLYDMSGNVYEWCWDWYDSAYYGKSPGAGPQGAGSGSYRLLRGGSWIVDDSLCRVSFRDGNSPDNSRNYIGFRVSRAK